MQLDWASETLKEVPFWRNDMQPEEYDYERSYFLQNWENYIKGEYQPLWWQAKQSNSFLTVLASFEHEFNFAIYCKISNESLVDDLKHIFINDTSYEVIEYNVVLISESKTLSVTLETNEQIKVNSRISF